MNSIEISLKFVSKSSINNIPALVQIMAWLRPGAKSLPEPMMDNLLTHICVTRPQWVKTWKPEQNRPHFANDIFKYIFKINFASFVLTFTFLWSLKLTISHYCSDKRLTPIRRPLAEPMMKIVCEEAFYKISRCFQTRGFDLKPPTLPSQ